jgi:hypothetical protein
VATQEEAANQVTQAKHPATRGVAETKVETRVVVTRVAIRAVQARVAIVEMEQTVVELRNVRVNEALKAKLWTRNRYSQTNYK